MRIADFIIALKKDQVEIEVLDGNLKITVPKGSNVLTDERKQQIRDRKAAIIEFFSKAGASRFALDIPAVEKKTDYPMSRSQRRFWVLNQLGESASVYNMCRSFLLEGILDADVLSKALRFVINRHESLRTLFKENEEGEVRQYILEPEKSPFVIHHLDISKEPDPESKLREIAAQEQLMPFDLRKSPPLRVKLVKLREDLYAFYYTMYHIISDGWSMEVLGREVISAYNAYRQGGIPDFSPLSFQYKDYTVWLEQNLYQEAETYWMEQLSGDLPVLNLPADKVRPPVKTHAGSSLSKTLTPAVITALKTFCQKDGYTLFMGLLAGIKALFYRYTGQEDIIIGTPIAGREYGELENQIGLYLNTLALRTRISGADSFEELLKKEKQVIVDAYNHQSYPLDLLIGALQPDRDMSRSPLFDVLIVSQIQDNTNPDQNESSFEGLSIQGIEKIDTTTSEYDLLFNFSESGDEVHLSITWNTDIYSQRNIQMLYSHLEQLLLAATDHPSSQISTLDYLSEIEKNTLLITLNNTDVTYPQDETLVTLFEVQVEKTPANIAVVFEEITLTYRELNERSNELAHYLRETHHVRPDKPVGIRMERSEHMIIAILGILKAGAVYVPIDPSFPEERITYIIKDADIELVLTEENIAVPSSVFSKQNPENLVNPDNLAYIIYTSGTTGNPKGVMIEHRNVVRLFFNDKNLFDFSATDVWTMFHAYNFDFSVWEMYGALLHGAKLIIVPSEICKDTFKFWQLLREKEVSVLNQTPSAFYNLIEVALEDEYDVKNLRYIIFGGEALKPQKLQRWKDTYPAVKLVNMYGITETTVHTTYKEITHAEIQAVTSNIGTAIPTLGIYILDNNLQLLPVGVPGEICITGAGLARGYINNPRLTEEKFIPDPFRTGARMYRSGDVGRWLPEGSIEFIGRKDHQVKIRGYRIELGEIEIALLRYEKIKGAIVLAEEAAEKYLAAYIVAEEVLDLKTLRVWLGKSLPDYMIPSKFTQLDKLPLTVNGKIDLKALPHADSSSISVSQEYIAPVGDVEEKLVKIWEEVLQKEQVGVEDDFFESGGHSLTAMQIISRIHKEMKVKVELRHFFMNPRLRELAKVISTASRNEYSDIVPVPQQEYYELSYAQKSIWVLSQFEERKIAYNISSVSMFEGELNISAFERSLEILVNRHESLRTTFIDIDGEPKQKIHPANPDWLGLIYTDLRNHPNKEEQVSIIRKKEINKPFNLVEGPLLSVKLLRVADNTFMLLFTIHHLICDGWSLNLLVEEVTLLYNSCRELATDPLKELRIQYKDYATWEKSRMASMEMEDARKFWLEHFNGGIKPVSLLGSRSASIIRNFKGTSHTFKLDNNLKQGLEQLERKYNVTLYVLMLSIFNVFLSKLSKEEEISILCANAGRDHIDLEKIIGVFVKTFGIKNFPSGSKYFPAFLNEVMERYLDVVKHDNYPFELLLNELNAGKQSAGIGNVYFQIDNFSSFETKKAKPGMGDVTVAALYNEASTSKADLMLYITQNPDEWYFTFEYKTGLFSQRKIELWSLWLRNLVSQLVADPQQKIAAYKLSDGKEPELYNLLDQSKEDLIQLYPLSARQEDFYLNCKILPDETAHRVVFYTVEENLDPVKWAEAITVIHEIFPILKTKVIESEGEVYQGIREKIKINTQEIDLSALHLSEEQLKEELPKYTTISHALDKELVKYFFIKISDSCFVNLISIHHLISDVTSSVIFFRKFDEVYGKRREEIPEELFQQYQYHDYVLNNLQQFDTREIAEYWKGKLKDVEPVGSNVYDDIVEESMEDRLILDAGHLDKIRKYCHQHNISEALYFRGLYSLMVHFYAGPENNFIINDITHGRDALTKDTFGCFTAILPLVYEQHVFSSPVESYLQYLKKQKKDIAGRQFLTVFLLSRLIGNQDLKFYYNYQVLYTLKEGATKLVKVIAHYAGDEVQFSLRDTMEGHTLILNYNKARFNATAFLERMVHVSTQLLDGAADLNKISYLLPGESEVTPVITPEWQPVHRLFEAQVKNMPDQVALTDKERVISYNELNEKANRLAHHLRKKYNIGNGDLIAVVADRSVEMIIGLLAIMKAGAAYVPIDPEYPEGRFSYICNNAGVKLVLTTTDYMFGISENYQGEIFALDIQLDGLENETADLPEISSDMAYIIYTSGSTGEPKGCMISHKNLSGYIQWANQYYWSDPESGNWALCTSISFDLTVTSIFTTLTRGRKLYISPQKDIAALLKDCLTNPEVDTIKITPSHISLIGTLELPLSFIRNVICGGEQLTLEQVNILRRINPDINIYNEYGPTETTVGCIVKKIEKGEQEIVIGQPITGTEILIMNRNGHLLPAGLPGEICISGTGVANGYMNNPTLTAEKFVSHPFRANERMYRSGDIGRWRQDGNIVFLGRKDQQVKIRGYRIELGEIETALLRHENIREAIVLSAKEKDSAELYLAAYLVMDNDLDIATLRSYLGDSLPAYMIPSAFTRVDQMPLTVNGKIDKTALQNNISATLTGTREYIAARNEVEEKLVRIWEEVLGKEPISVLDDFFELGGHSLKAMQVVSRIHKEFNTEMELGKIFEFAVLEKLAESISNDVWFRDSLDENIEAFKEIKI